MAIEHTAVRQLRDRSFGPLLSRKIYVPLPIAPSEVSERRESKRMASKKQLVSELKPGEKVDSYFSVSYKKPVLDYKYGSMFEFRVADNSGQTTVKYWGGPDKAAVESLHDSFDRGDIVRVRGEVSEYKGLTEISVSDKNGGEIKMLADGEYDISQLVRTFENIDHMKLHLLKLADTVQEPHLKQLLDSFFGDKEFMEAFAQTTASIQLHSAGVGGLIFHTIHVGETCLKICELHPELDKDLVMTGALLHDIGKVQSFRVTSNISLTEVGNLLGHVVLGDQELVARIARIEGFPELLKSKLRHILLSHHGKKEWGSPVEPMFPEALAVHEADDLDAKLDNMIAKREGAVTEDDWIWDSRHGRLIYLK